MWPLFTSITTDKIELYISTLLCNLVSVATESHSLSTVYVLQDMLSFSICVWDGRAVC